MVNVNRNDVCVADKLVIKIQEHVETAHILGTITLLHRDAQIDIIVKNIYGITPIQ